MLNLVKHMFVSNPDGSFEVQTVNRKIKSLYLFLGLANLAVWAWAVISLRDSAALLGTALLAYSFGLRHALDVDHIGAIDNVIRRLMHDGKKPVAVGLFFALGHSMIVVGASLAIGLMAKSVAPYLQVVQEYGGLIGSVVSIVFLLAIGILNAVMLLDTYRQYKAGDGEHATRSSHTHVSGGILGRILKPLVGNIASSWHMIFLGALFGLGFETATEIAVLSTSALQASLGASLAIVLLFPCLFTVGMLTVDALDGVFMLNMYGWAFVQPRRKIFYNMTLTLTSTAVALLIAGINIASMAREYYGLESPAWAIMQALHDNYTLLGGIIIAVFVVAWIISLSLYRRTSDDLVLGN